jgi:DNA (cytosine-5)-methyltransferase 1
MRVLDLFSGIGGFSLGLERAGMRTVAFCEIDPYCRAVLARHWPDVPCFGDISAVTADTDCEGELQPSGPLGQERRRLGDCGIEVICGGFPCQDISVAGKGAGLAGARSGLWSEYARLIRELRPRYVIVENVSALLSRGLEQVLGDLAEIGYDAEWHCIPASYVGAPHRRDRVWIVAYPDGRRRGPDFTGGHDAHRTNTRRPEADCLPGTLRETDREGIVAHTDSNKRHGRSGSMQVGRGEIARETSDDGYTGGAQWSSEPDVGRVAHGVPARVDRLRALGNAVVPQVVEIIERAIMEHANGMSSELSNSVTFSTELSSATGFSGLRYTGREPSRSGARRLSAHYRGTPSMKPPLTEQLEDAQAAHAYLGGRYVKLQAERDKYRIALEQIKGATGGNGLPFANKWARGIAEEALKHD